MIREHYDLAEAALLAREIMLADAAAYGPSIPRLPHQPYRGNLAGRRRHYANPGFGARYVTFQRDMVHGESADFETAIAALVALAAQVEAGET